MGDLDGTPAAVLDPPVQPAASAAPPDWRTYVTDDLKADPVVKSWAEKASEKDIPSLIKGYAHASHKMGSAINLPGKDAKPEDVSAFKTKLYDAGVFERPPADPKDYAITKPEKLPDGVGWNDEFASKLAATLHKHGVSKAAVPDLLALHQEILQGTTTFLQTNEEDGIRALKIEHAEHFDERMEAAKRMIGGIFKDAKEVEMFNQLGLGNHPGFLSVLMRLAPLALSDSSFMQSVPQAGGEKTREEVLAEVAAISSDKAHPMYKDYHAGNKKAMDYVDDLYRRAVGNAPVQIGGEGISTG